MNPLPPSAIMLMGPPGSGKSYAGKLLADELGYIEVDTGEIIKHMIFDSAHEQDPEVRREKEIYLSGKLNTETWVARLISETAQKLHRENKGVVFSGSPRTMSEAEALVPLLLRLYGHGLVYALLFNVERDESLRRIKNRRVCDTCGRSIMPDDSSSVCPSCGGRIVEKRLDDPTKLAIRFEEYEKRTMPILAYMKERGILHEVDAMPLPEKIIESILTILNQNLEISK